MSANELFGDAVIVGILIVLACLPLLVRFHPRLRREKTAAAAAAEVGNDTETRDDDAPIRLITRLNNDTMAAVIALVLAYVIGFIAIQVLDDVIEEHLGSEFEAQKIANDKEFEALKMADPNTGESKLSPVRVAELDIRGDEGMRAALNHDKSYIHILRGGALALVVFLASMVVFLLPREFLGTRPPTRTGYVVGFVLLALGVGSIFGVFEENREAEKKYEKVVYHLWKEQQKKGAAETETANQVKQILGQVIKPQPEPIPGQKKSD